MIERGVFSNLGILLLLLPAMLATFWWFLRLLNRSTGFNLRNVLKKIYSDPLAAAIYRGAVVLACAYIVVAGFSRWV